MNKKRLCSCIYIAHLFTFFMCNAQWGPIESVKRAFCGFAQEVEDADLMVLSDDKVFSSAAYYVAVRRAGCSPGEFIKALKPRPQGVVRSICYAL